MRKYIRTSTEPIFAMARIKPYRLHEPFGIWMDDAGNARLAGQLEPRFKFFANDIELEFVLHSEDSIEVVNNGETQTQNILKFNYVNEVKQFIQQYWDLLLLQWNNKIDAMEFLDIIRLMKTGRTQKEAFKELENRENAYFGNIKESQ